MKVVKRMKTELMIVERPAVDYKTSAPTNLKVVVAVVVHESPQNSATTGSAPSSLLWYQVETETMQVAAPAAAVLVASEMRLAVAGDEKVIVNEKRELEKQ